MTHPQGHQTTQNYDITILYNFLEKTLTIKWLLRSKHFVMVSRKNSLLTGSTRELFFFFNLQKPLKTDLKCKTYKNVIKYWFGLYTQNICTKTTRKTLNNPKLSIEIRHIKINIFTIYNNTDLCYLTINQCLCYWFKLPFPKRCT